MEVTKNLCAQIPETLHARVRTEQEQSGQTLSQYVTALITEYYQQKEGRKMGGTRTMAFQIPEELDLRDIDGIRQWFVASLTGMGNLLDLITESPALTGAAE